MLSFTYEALPARVVFGSGAVTRLPEELDRLGVRKALVLCTQQQWGVATHIATILGDRYAGTFDRAVMHVPIEVAEAAREEAARVGADACVAVGGGSTTGLAKAIALTSDLPILAVPTTYAGSEMTPIWGLTQDGHKKTGRDLRVLPRTVIYDPGLTLTLPVEMSVVSGINAIAHCVEALYSKDANPITWLAAEDGIRAMAGALPRIVKNAIDPAAGADAMKEARADALYGAWLGGMVLGAVGMALHHKLCHTLGGSFGLPHAETHTVVLPHAVAYNASAVPEAMARVTRALRPSPNLNMDPKADANAQPKNDPSADLPKAEWKTVPPAAALWDLAAHLGAPVSLEAIGMRRRDLERAADLAVENPYWNPRPITRAGVRMLLEDAFVGRRPGG